MVAEKSGQSQCANSLSSHYENRLNLRDKAFIPVLYETGCRIGISSINDLSYFINCKQFFWKLYFLSVFLS